MTQAVLRKEPPVVPSKSLNSELLPRVINAGRALCIDITQLCVHLTH